MGPFVGSLVGAGVAVGSRVGVNVGRKEGGGLGWPRWACLCVGLVEGAAKGWLDDSALGAGGRAWRCSK